MFFIESKQVYLKELGLSFNSFRSCADYLNKNYWHDLTADAITNRIKRAFKKSNGQPTKIYNLSRQDYITFILKSFNGGIKVEKKDDRVYFSEKSDGTIEGTIGADVCKNTQELAKKLNINTNLYDIYIERYGQWTVKAEQWEKTNQTIRFKIQPRKEPKLEYDHIKKIYDRIRPKKVDIPKIKPKTKNELMCVIPLVDLHLGKLSWDKETGNEYNIKIATQRFLEIEKEVLTNRTKPQQYLLQVGQDFFNFDNLEGSTTRQTPQDNDVRYYKMFEKGVNLFVGFVDRLKKIAPVKLVFVSGNHDRQSSYHLIKMLQLYYKYDRSVSFESNNEIFPKKRKYILWGHTLLGFTHGALEKNNITHLMHSECPQKWGQSRYRVWFVGHLHHLVTKEVGGVEIRTLSSISAPDNYHYQKGLTTSKQASQYFFVDKNKGIVSEYTVVF